MKSSPTQALLKLSLVILVAATFSSGCGSGSSSSSEDTSASGAAAGAAGGALSNSSSGGTLAFVSMPAHSGSWYDSFRASMNPLANAYASSVCPTYKSSLSGGCDASGSTMWLTYDSCSFGGATAVWNGAQALTMSSGTPDCGTFPNPGDSGTLTRQYVVGSGSTTPSKITVTSSRGTEAIVDDASANLDNFAGDTIATVENGGFGNEIIYNSKGARSGININHRIYVTGSFDHSITGSLSIDEDSAGATTRVITGHVTVYHNLLKVVGTSVFNSVVHKDACCFPVGGSITTTFAASDNTNEPPTTAGLVYTKSTGESLSFTGCGTATFTDVSGTVSNVQLTRCF